MKCTMVMDTKGIQCGEEAIIFELSGLRCCCATHYKYMKWVWDAEISEGLATTDEAEYHLAMLKQSL